MEEKWLPWQQAQKITVKLLLYVQVKLDLACFISTVRRTSINLVALVGCHGSMVTMTMVSNNLPLCVPKGITSKFHKLLPWNQNFSVKIKVL